MANSPDGTAFAAGSSDGAVYLWDIRNESSPGPPLTGHTAGVNSVAFSPDGRTLVTGSSDKTIRLWPVPTMSLDALCAKLTENMSEATWKFWLPNMPYHGQCPGLPRSDD